MVRIQLPEDYSTKYEKARLIGARALQISMGAPFLMKITDEQLKKINYNPIEIAKLEFENDALNIDIKRLKPHERR
jgi:DNA-directed RNA polymerase subunit K